MTTLVKNQKIEMERRPLPGTTDSIQPTIRFDDECGNGHNSFSITATIYDKRGRDIGGGCCHDDIVKAFPKLKPFIKWHLSSTDGPMYYIANTTYHASTHDCNGLEKDEQRQIKNGRTGELVWKAVTSNKDGEQTELRGITWTDSNEKPANDGGIEWVPVYRIGEGKESDLSAARSSAVWPEATLEQLTDEQALADRLPALLVDMQADVESLGLVW